MYTLLFEVEPREGHERHYFERAAELKPELEKNPGLFFLDRYRSLKRPARILSYQHWRDEAALVDWRKHAGHRRAQSAGRQRHFADYRIRIGEVIVDASPDRPAIEPDVPTGTERFVLLAESEGAAFETAGESFASLNRPGVHATIATAATLSESKALVRAALEQGAVTRVLLSRVVRDYGMYERDEAPQKYPETVKP